MLAILKRWCNQAIFHFSKCMEPVIPLLLAGGLIKLLIIMLSAAGILSDGDATKAILVVISDAPFYFLPVFVAYVSAKHFETEPLYAMVAVSAMLLPSFVRLTESAGALTFAAIPVAKASYAATALPAVLLSYLLSRLLIALRRVLRGAWGFFIPVSAIFITALLGILLVGPASAAIGELLAGGINRLYELNPAAACALLGFLLPLMVVTGAHWVFVTLTITRLSLEGIDPFFMPLCFCLVMSLSASMLAVFLKSDGELKKTALSAGITAFTTGTSEPALFGVCVPYKTPLLAVMLASGLSGAYQGYVSVNCYIYAFPCIFSVLMFSGPDAGNLLRALISGGFAFTSALVLTWLLYKPKSTVVSG